MVKILSKSQKDNLSERELINYQNKLVKEVNRRAARFDIDDKVFAKWRAKYSLNNETNNSSVFANANENLTRDYRLISIKVLEDVINSKRSTKKGRKESSDKAFETFRERYSTNEKTISRRFYNKFIQAFEKVEEDSFNGMVEDYMLSEQIRDVFIEGYDTNAILNAIIAIGTTNLPTELRKRSGEMIIAVLRGEDVDDLLERYGIITTSVDTNE